MAVLFGGGKMMFLGLAKDTFKDKEGKDVALLKTNLMDIETNEIHIFSVPTKNEVLVKQLQGLQMASVVKIVFALEYDKYAVNKKQNPSKFKLSEVYPG